MAIESSLWTNSPSVRVFGGAAIGERSGRLKVALVRCSGDGWNVRVLRTDAVTLPLLDSANGKAIGLAKAIGQAIVSLAGQVDVPLAAIDSLGLDMLRGHSAELAHDIAERTGLTVVTCFSDRDRAVGGRGHPLSPVADWILYGTTRLTRLLVHLGPSVQLTMLVAGKPAANVVCFDAGPGSDFLDALTNRLSSGRYPFDPTGHFAVQGHQSEELIAQWLSHPFLVHPIPRFVDRDTFEADFLESSIAFAQERRLGAKDLLCSANHFVSRAIQDAVRRLLPGQPVVHEVIVSGGGIRNGLLWKLLNEALAGLAIRRTDDLGIPAEVRTAVHAALLGLLAMENLPGNVPSVTGASAYRVLGAIIPGSQSNWDRWVCNLADRFDSEARRAA